MTGTAGSKSEGVLVVVPCMNEERHLKGLLETILNDRGARDARVVIVDGGSTDSSCEIVRSFAASDPRVVLLINPARIQSAGVNLAVARYGEGCEWLIRVDAHAKYPSDYIARLIDAALQTGADSVVVPMRAFGETCFQRATASAQNSFLGNGGSRHRRSGVSGWVDHGHHALFLMEAFKGVKGYDGGFSHNEDVELDIRLMAAGRRIWLANELVISYFPRSNGGALLRQYFAFGMGRARTFRKHRVRLRLRHIIPLMMLPFVIISLASPLLWILATPIWCWVTASLMVGAVLGIREKSVCAAAAGVPALLMHLGWSAGYWRFLLRLTTAPKA